MSKELSRAADGLTPRRPGTVAVPGAGVPVHRAGELSFRPSVDPAMVPLAIRDRLVAQASSVHEDTAGRSTTGGGTGPATPVELPNDTMADFLGNLPTRAQQLLQEPFAGRPVPPRGDHHYLRTRGSGGLGRTDLEVSCYLFDREWLTCVSGSAATYGQSFAAARWELTCRRIAVRPR